MSVVNFSLSNLVWQKGGTVGSLCYGNKKVKGNHVFGTKIITCFSFDSPRNIIFLSYKYISLFIKTSN